MISLFQRSLSEKPSVSCICVFVFVFLNVCLCIYVCTFVGCISAFMISLFRRGLFEKAPCGHELLDHGLGVLGRHGVLLEVLVSENIMESCLGPFHINSSSSSSFSLVWPERAVMSAREARCRASKMSNMNTRNKDGEIYFENFGNAKYNLKIWVQECLQERSEISYDKRSQKGFPSTKSINSRNLTFKSSIVGT